MQNSNKNMQTWPILEHQPTLTHHHTLSQSSTQRSAKESCLGENHKADNLGIKLALAAWQSPPALAQCHQ